jgi:hypothetical protein
MAASQSSDRESSSSGARTELDLLRARADLSRYILREPAHSWVKCLTDAVISDLGALVMLGTPGAFVRDDEGVRRSLQLVPETLVLSALASRVRGTGRLVGIGLAPAGARFLPLTMAIDALLASALDRSVERGASRLIWVVTPDLAVRSRYCDIRIGKQALDEAYPGYRSRADGSAVAIRQSKASTLAPGLRFAQPTRGILRSRIDKGSLVILDVRFASGSAQLPEILRWAVAGSAGGTGIVVLFSNGDQTAEALLRGHKAVIVPVDHAGVAECCSSFTCSGEGAGPVPTAMCATRCALERQHEILLAEASDRVEAKIARLRLAFDRLRREEANLDVRRAKWILAQLAAVATPLTEHELAARSLGRFILRTTIDRLGLQSGDRPDLGPEIQSIRMELDALYNELSQHNPKQRSIEWVVPLLASELPAGGALVVVARDPVAARALETWLRRERPGGITREVRVTSWSHLARERYELRSSSTVILGAVPRRFTFALAAPLGPKVYFVAYPSEAQAIAAQLRRVYSEADITTRKAERDASVALLLGLPVARQNVERTPFPKLELTIPEATAVGLPERSLEQVLSDGAVYEGDIEGEEAGLIDYVDSGPQRMTAGQHGSDAVPSAEVTVSTNGVIGKVFLPLSEPVECVRHADGKLTAAEPMDLRAGDILLRFDEHSRGSLFEQVLNIANDDKSTRWAIVEHGRWTSAMQTLRSRYRRRDGQPDYGEILRLLRRSGATIETEFPVRCWLTGVTLGPASVESIRAVGQLLDDPSYSFNATRLHSALRAIRSFHSAVGRRLNDAIRASFRQFASDAVASNNEMSLGEGLAAAVDDLLETIELSEVITVATDEVMCPPQLLHRFMDQ